MVRLFIALDLPEPIKDQVETLQDRRIHARWTTRPQWHITLHFLGERDDTAAIRSLLAEIQAASFSLRLNGVGTFPERGKPRVLWAGIEAPPALQQLYTQIGDALKTLDFQPDRRPYAPHLTLARFNDAAPPRDVLRGYLQQHETFSTEPFQITHVTLYASKLERSGAVYTALERVSLFAG